MDEVLKMIFKSSRPPIRSYFKFLSSELRHIPFDKLIVYALALCIFFGEQKGVYVSQQTSPIGANTVQGFVLLCQCSQLLSSTFISTNIDSYPEGKLHGLGLRAKYLDLVNMDLYRTLIKINLHSTDLEFTSLKFIQVFVTPITCLGLSVNYRFELFDNS
ncbi:hypothetical protein HZH66_004915 [Vespula vulgaris]|uniref:Uncharacterized protein n=1 Tax=Vespula vulgaris TaxID=7454 RepID=A0A834NCQ6_VESVU|nr:hypothetical protein HZH66_004915 [Vespula vulgaris]